MSAVSERMRGTVIPAGGYRVVPDSVEFFQGYGPLQHDRFLYVRKEPDGWTIEQLD